MSCGRAKARLGVRSDTLVPRCDNGGNPCPKTGVAEYGRIVLGEGARQVDGNKSTAINAWELVNHARLRPREG